ncbi:transposase family protein [Labrys sp. 22185]|uniref:transposase family protein n=1 Tax=Labrys sp. 22185 TaxID=3453888 RepID=UPI003F853888
MYEANCNSQVVARHELRARGRHVDRDGPDIFITVHAKSHDSPCLGCGTRSSRIHSRYYRRLTDLPLSGRSVRLCAVARRFRCDWVICKKRIFVERFDGDALALCLEILLASEGASTHAREEYRPGDVRRAGHGRASGPSWSTGRSRR